MSVWHVLIVANTVLLTVEMLCGDWLFLRVNRLERRK